MATYQIFYTEVKKYSYENQKPGGAALHQPIYVMAELKPILTELRAWGKNLNQLTTLAHQGRVQTAYLQELTAALGKTYEAVSKLAEKGPVIHHGNL